MDAQITGGGEYIEQTRSSRSATWKSSGKEVIRINMDAAFSTGMDKCGLGWVARDWKGRVLKAWAKSARKTSEPLVEEATTIRMGMVKVKKAQ